MSEDRRKIKIFALIIIIVINLITNGFVFREDEGKQINALQEDQIGTIFAINEPISLIVREIVGDFFRVETILPPGVDPHSFQLTPDLVEELAESSLIVLVDPNNFGLERKIVDLDSLRGIPKLFIHNYTEYGWAYLYVEGFGLDHHGAWLSPRNGLAIAFALKDFLEKEYFEIRNEINDNFMEFKEAIINYIFSLKNLSETHETSKYKTVCLVPPLAYIANWTGMGIDEIVLSEPDEELSLTRYNEIIDKLKEETNYIIMAPKELKGTRVGELAEQLARESGKPLIYLPVFSTSGASNYIDFLKLATYPTFSVLGINYPVGKKVGGISIYLYFALIATTLISIVEAYIIYLYKRSEWEEAGVE